MQMVKMQHSQQVLVTRNTTLIFQAEGFIENDNGDILAMAAATYAKQSIERIAGEALGEEDWFILPDDVKSIDVKNVDYFDIKHF